MDLLMTSLRAVCRTLILTMACAGTLLWADRSEATILSPSGPITVATNQIVSFTASSIDSWARDSYAVTSYSWAFGDGSTGAGASIGHPYTSPGTYTATLTVSYTFSKCLRYDVDGNCTSYGTLRNTATATRLITVLAPPSISSFTADHTVVRAGQPVTLTWSTTNATSVSISGVGAVPGTSVVVYPTATTTTYTLTASNTVASATPVSLTVSTYTVSVAISPPSASIPLGGSQTFTATVSPPNQDVSWSASGGSLSGGTFTGTSSGTFTVTATSLEDPSKSASATVTVAAAAVGPPSPANASINVGGTLQYSATVSGAVNTGVNWSVNGGGTIGSGGLFSATTAGTYTVTATSAADGTKSASTQVTVVPVSVGTPSPANATVNAGSTLQYSATVSGAANTAVTWSVTGGGTISTSGLFSATTAGTFTVTATSVADTGMSASTQVVVKSVVTGVSISPLSASLLAGGSQTFTASVSGLGGPSTAVTWSATVGIITSGGVYTAPITGGTYIVTAVSAQDGMKTASASVTVGSIAVGTPTPSNATVNAGSTQQYSATVTGAANAGVTWSVSGGGTISASGLFSATTAGTYVVTAKSVADSAMSASTNVTVKSVVTEVTINPTTASLKAGEAKTFTAAVSGLGGPSTAVKWSTTGGTITTGGVYTAPITGGAYTVTVASAQDDTKKALAAVTVSPIIVSTPSPANATVNTGSTLQYSATVSGAANAGITWSVTGGGTISGTGLFTATTAGTFTVKATSAADPTKSASTSVVVKGWVLKWKRDIVYVGGKELAEVDATGASAIYTDHLGSPRLSWKGGTNPVVKQKFLPFGEQLGSPTDAAKLAKGFTNHEQTDPSGLIYMQARYYLPMYGRFGSPDPARDQHFELTQSWNIYSYVMNTPTMLTDPTGMAADGAESEARAGRGLDWITEDRTGNPILNSKNTPTKKPLAQTNKKCLDGAPKPAPGVIPPGGRPQSITPATPQPTTKSKTATPGTSQIWVDPELRSTSNPLTRPAIAVVTDIVGFVPGFRAIGTAGNIANDNSGSNILLNGMSQLPVLGDAVGVGNFVADVGLLAGTFWQQYILAPMFNAAPPKMVNDGNGHTVPNPALMNEYDILLEIK